MPPERFPPNDAREWVRRARSNLRLAQTLPSDVDVEDLCFDAQQAAEKAIKAVFIARGIAFPHIHDLLRLRALLARVDEQVPCAAEDAVALTSFAGRARYPSDDEPVTEEEYRRAVAIAEVVIG